MASSNRRAFLTRGPAIAVAAFAASPASAFAQANAVIAQAKAKPGPTALQRPEPNAPKPIAPGDKPPEP